jgi:hypothetical protein
MITIISVAIKTFKNAHFGKCVIVHLMAPWKNNYELVLKAKIRAAPFPTVLNPHPTPSLKKGESTTTCSLDMSQAHPSYFQQFLSVNVSNHAAQCQTL